MYQSLEKCLCMDIQILFFQAGSPAGSCWKMAFSPIIDRKMMSSMAVKGQLRWQFVTSQVIFFCIVYRHNENVESFCYTIGNIVKRAYLKKCGCFKIECEKKSISEIVIFFTS